MLLRRRRRTSLFAFIVLSIVGLSANRSQAQAALLLEQPYGFFGTLNPTGHTAIYFANICAETPVKLRRCEPGEPGTIISRYQGIAGYDWVAIAPIPYFYSVEDSRYVPAHVDKAIVRSLRSRYHEEHLGYLGQGVFEGNLVRGGWTQLVGAAYERRTYAFRFATAPEQDDDVIALLNSGLNRSDFNLLYSNCADFIRTILNIYLPHTFKRSFFPDAGMTTPKQITDKLTRYSRKHPELHLTVFEIPQVLGYRRLSHSNKSISESLITTGYAVPIIIINPYVAGAIFLDYVTRGRFPSVPKHAPALAPDELSTLQLSTGGIQKADVSLPPAHAAAVFGGPEPAAADALSCAEMKEIATGHE